MEAYRCEYSDSLLQELFMRLPSLPGTETSKNPDRFPPTSLLRMVSISHVELPTGHQQQLSKSPIPPKQTIVFQPQRLQDSTPTDSF